MTVPYGLRIRHTNMVAVLALLFVVLAAAAEAKPVRLLVLGDSLAAGYGLPQAEGFQAQLAQALKARGHDVTIVDGAVSGDTSAGGRARLEWSLGEGADAALVELGANDGLRGVPPSDMQANLAAILDTLKARNIPVLLAGMEAPPNMGAEYARAFREVFATLAKRPGVLFYPFFLEGVAADPALNQPDRIHPNAEGVKVEVRNLLPIVERLLGKAGGGS